jgi:hypothetical protein
VTDLNHFYEPQSCIFTQIHRSLAAFGLKIMRLFGRYCALGALLGNTLGPSRRQMLKEMIARELIAAARLESMPSSFCVA